VLDEGSLSRIFATVNSVESSIGRSLVKLEYFENAFRVIFICIYCLPLLMLSIIRVAVIININIIIFIF